MLGTATFNKTFVKGNLKSNGNWFFAPYWFVPSDKENVFTIYTTSQYEKLGR